MAEETAPVVATETFVVEGTVYNPLRGAAGLENVLAFLENVRVGAFLKLAPGESVTMQLKSKNHVMLWQVHKVPAIDETGKEYTKMTPCRSIYFKEVCSHCADPNKKIARLQTRTAGVFHIFRESVTQASTGKFAAKKSMLAYQDTLIFEGGPLVWKNGIMPTLVEHTAEAYLRVTRSGSMLDTKYQVVAISNPVISEEELKKAKEGEPTSGLGESLMRETLEDDGS